MSATSQRYFFLEGKNAVLIEEFNYDYVLNSLLKVFDRKSTEKRKYYTEVVVSRTFDRNGVVSYDVRRLDLMEIYFDSTSLRALLMMVDDIYFGDRGNSVYKPNMPLPPLKKEWEDWKAGKVVLAPAIIPAGTETSMPAPIVRTRTEIAENDPRILEIDKPVDFELNPIKALDWVENFEMCSSELTVDIQQLSTEQMQMVSLMKTNSEFINSIFANLTRSLESIFPIKPTLMRRWFGNTNFVVEQADISSIMSVLNTAVNVDTSRFSGIETVFERIGESIEDLKLNIEHGIHACNYAIESSDEEEYSFEIRLERLMKVRASTGSSELSLRDNHMKFLTNYNNLVETQTVLIPLIITRLQTMTGNVVDEDTVSILRSLAGQSNGK